MGYAQEKFWELQGNSGTDKKNFMGTTDCNFVIFKTNNTERMRLLSDRSFLGIGLQNPYATMHLHLQVDAQPCNIGIRDYRRLLQMTTPETGYNINNGFSISSFETKDILFQQHEQAKFSIMGYDGGFTIAPNGNIGIGTETPLHKFHIYDGNLLITKTMANPSGSIFFRDIDDDVPEKWEIRYGNTLNKGDGLDFGKYNLINDLPDNNEYEEDMRGNFRRSVFFLGNNGNVGIGTKFPKAKLDVNGSLNVQDASITGTLFANNFNVQSATIGDLTITPDGNIGIGTDVPHQKLHIVDGNILISKTSTKAPQSTNGSILFGADINSNTYMGKWAIEYLNENDIYGLNFWRPWNPSGGGFGNYYLFLADNGNVGIGTSNPTAKLDVLGTIRAKEVKVCLNQGCDFVFDDDYKLMSLQELDNFIKVNKHLPDVAPAVAMEAEGINLSEMNALLIQKMEELTLYIIDLQKQINELKPTK